MSTNRTDNSLWQDGKRRRSSRSVSPMPPRCLDDNINTPAFKRTRTSPRFLFDTCDDISGLPPEFRCSGCVHYKDYGTKPRNQCTTDKCKCWKAWTRDEADVPNIKRPHCNKIMGFINHHMQIDSSALKVTETPKPQQQQQDAATRMEIDVTPSPPQPVPQAEVELIEKKIRSNGQEFTFNIPSTHRIVHKDHLKRWYNDSRTLRRVRAKMQSMQYSTCSIFSQGLWSIALTSAPALALSAAQHLFPLLLYAFFYDTGLMRNLELGKHATSFPSDNTLRKYNLLQATRDTMLLGRDLRERKIYIACDKGNKKGVGHFVKVLASLDDDGLVQPKLLDIDASGGTSAECAAAIKASMNKLKDNDDDVTHLLYGQSTDSGGGGTLESLHEHMKVLQLCAPDDVYLTAPCCIHALQIQLKNAVVETFGEGALDRVNAMQMLHSAHRLQESLDLDEWRHVLLKSSLWVSN